MRLGFRAGVILGEDVDIARRDDLIRVLHARVGVVIAVRRQRRALDFANREAAALLDDGLRIARVVGVDLHVSGRTDRRAAIHISLRILTGRSAVADIGLRVGAGRFHKAGRAARFRLGRRPGIISRLHIQIAAGDDDLRAIHKGLRGIRRVALRIQVAERRQTERAAVLRQRLRQILGLRKHGHLVRREGQRLGAARRADAIGVDEHTVLAGALRIGVVDGGRDDADRSGRSIDRRHRTVTALIARCLIQLGNNLHIARHRGAANAEDIGILPGRQVGFDLVERDRIAADGELMRAHLGNRIGGGVHRDAHIAVHGQAAVATKAGVAGHGGLRVRRVDASIFDACAQSAGRSGFSKAVNRIGGADVHAAGAALPRARPERRGERAGRIRVGHHQADVDVGNAASGYVDARIGKGFCVGEHIDDAGHVQRGAADLGGGCRRDGRARLAGFAADEGHLCAAAGAHLCGRRVIAGRAFGIEAGLDVHACRLDRRALNLRLLGARNIRGDDVDRHIHDAGREVLALNVRRRLGLARHDDAHCAAGDIDHAVSVDAGVGGHIRPGISDVIHDAEAGQVGALAGLRGNRLGVGRIVVADGNTRGVHIAGNQGIEAALRIGIQGIDADADAARREVLAVHQRVRIGPSGDVDEKRAVDHQLRPDNQGLVGEFRRRDRHIRLRGCAGKRRAAAAAVGAQDGVSAPGLVLVQIRRERDAARGQTDRIDIRLLARVQRRGHGIGRHIGQATGHGGLFHRRLCRRNAGRLDDHRVCLHRARAGEVCVDPGRVLRNRDVHLDIVFRDVHACGGRRQHCLDRAGGIRLHGHVAGIGLQLTGGVVRHDHECVKAALPIGVRRAQRCGNLADSAHVGDFRQRVGIALGQDIDAARRVDGTRTQARIGLGADIGHCNIDAHVDQRAAAGIQPGLGALRRGIVRVEEGLRRDAACVHMAFCQGRFLTGAEHRRSKGRIHADSANVHAVDRRAGRRRAVSHDLQARRSLQLAAANDVGEIARVVVRDGGVHAHGDRARRARDRVRSRLSPVVRFFRSRVNAELRRADLGALGVNHGLIAGTQMDIAHGEANARRANRRRKQLRFGYGVIEGNHTELFVGRDIRADDPGHGVRLVEDQKRIAVDRDSTARHRQEGRKGRAGGVVLHRDDIRRHAALARGGRAGSLAVTVGRCADGGQDFRRNHRHRRGHVDRRAAKGHAQDIRLGMGVHIRRDVKASIGIQGDALADERVHAAAVDHQRHRAVRAYAARRKGAGAAHGIGVLRRFDRNAIVDLDVRVARDGSLHRAAKDGCGHRGANARDAARRRQRRGQHERIVHDRLDGQRFSLLNAAFHAGEDIGVDIDRANRRGHARDGAGARDGDRPDGAGGQVDRVLSLKRLLQRVDAVAVRILHRRGARPRGNLNRSLRGQYGVVLHLGQHVGIQHHNRDARAHARVHAAGDGTGNHIRDQVVIGRHLDDLCRGHTGRAADQGADAVLRIVVRPGCAEIPRSRDIRVLALVDHEVIAAGVLALAAFRIEFIAAVSVLGIEGMLRIALAVRLRAAHGDFGLADAVSLQKQAHVALAVFLRGAVTGCEGFVQEGVRLEAAGDAFMICFLLLVGELLVFLARERIALADQRVARILRQLAARNGHHDRRADANLARRDRARVGIDVAIRSGVHGNRARQAFDLVLLADARGNRVVDHVDHGRNADANHAAARKRGRDRVGGQRVPGVNGDGIRFDFRTLVRHSLRGLLEDSHIHRAGNAGRAADGDARGVGREELLGIGHQGEALLGGDVRAASDDRAGRAFIIGNDTHRRDARRAAASHRAGDVEQIIVRDSLDSSFAARADHAAHARPDVVLEHQRVRANGDGCRAGARKVQRQQQHIIIGNSRNLHVTGCAHKLHRADDGLAVGGLAHSKDCFNRLVIDHHDGGSAHARRAAHGSAAGDVN